MSVSIFGILMIIGVLGIGTLAIFLGVKLANKQNKLLQEQAKKRNGNIIKPPFLSRQITNPKVVFLHRDVEISFFFSGSKYENYTNFKFNLSSIKDCNVVICKKTLINKIGEMLSLQNIQVGNSNFDNEFIVKSNDKTLIYDILTSDIQCKLLEYKLEEPIIKIKRGSFILTVPKNLYEEKDCDKLIDLGLMFCDRLKSLA